MRTIADAAASTPGGLWPGLLFAIGAAALGFLPAALTFSLRRNAADAIGLTAVKVPAWAFISVWLVIYPCIGVAAWRLTLTGPAGRAGASVALAILAAGFLQSLSFWLTDSLRSIAVIDATGVLMSLTAAFALYRVDSSASWWLAPWVAWMPITLAIKLHAIRRSGQRPVSSSPA